MADPIITVTISAYNHAAFIAEAIESALSQGIENTEVLVIDDASIDDTAIIAEGFAARDPRVLLIRHKNNLGPSAASEEHLRLARGEYIATLASDDAFEPGKLSAQLAYFKQHPNAAMVATGATFMDDRSRPITHNRHFAAGIFDSKPRNRGQWLRYFFNSGNNICAPSAMFRTDIFRKHGALDLRLVQRQDHDCWVRLVLAGYDIGMIDAPLTRYRIRSNQANLSAPTVAARASSLFEYVEILNRYHALSHLEELIQMLPNESPVLPDGVNEEAYVQHRLALHAWNLGTPHHRMFALNNWYRLLGRDEWRAGLEMLGVNAPFLARKTAHYPLAEALALTPKGTLRRQAERFLPPALRNAIARKIRARRDV